MGHPFTARQSTGPSSVITVAPSGGDYATIQGAIDAAVAGSLLGYTYALMRINAVPADGDYIHVAATGHPTLADSDHIYEFDTDTIATQTCPCGTNHLIDVSWMTELTEVMDGEVGILGAFDAQHGANGDGSMRAGGVIEATYAGLDVYMYEPADWKYFSLSVHSDVIDLDYTQSYRDPDAPTRTIEVYPGDYNEEVFIPRNVHVRGVEKESVRIYGGAVQRGVVNMDTDSSLRNVTVEAVPDGTSGLTGISMGNFGMSSSNIEVTDCRIISARWGVTTLLPQGSGVTCDHLALKRCDVFSSDTISFNRPVFLSDVSDNRVFYEGAYQSCFTFIDTVGAGFYRNSYRNNIVELRHDGVGSAGPYAFRLQSWGDVIEGNVLRLISPKNSSTPSAFIYLAGGVGALPSTEADMLPLQVLNNTIEFIFPAGTTAFPSMIAGIYALEGNTFGTIPKIVLSNNLVSLIGEGATPVFAVHMDPVEITNPCEVEVRPGGLGGLEGETVNVDANVTVTIVTPAWS